MQSFGKIARFAMNAKAAKIANNGKNTDRTNISMRNKIDKITKTAKFATNEKVAKIEKGQRKP